MSTSSCTSKRVRRGSAMVEMAILLPLLVLLFVGITDLGRALLFQQRLVKAVESGARYVARSWQAVDTAACSPAAGWDAALDAAANLAVFGSVSGGATPAVPGFAVGDITTTVQARDVAGVGTVCVVRMEASAGYRGMFFVSGGSIPLLGADSEWQMLAASEERYVGD